MFYMYVNGKGKKNKNSTFSQGNFTEFSHILYEIALEFYALSGESDCFARRPLVTNVIFPAIFILPYISETNNNFNRQYEAKMCILWLRRHMLNFGRLSLKLTLIEQFKRIMRHVACLKCLISRKLSIFRLLEVPFKRLARL